MPTVHRTTIALLLFFLVFMGKASASDKDVRERLMGATSVLKEIGEIPEKGIPRDLLDRSACVAVIPAMKKGGFIFGGNYGRGAISCRTDQGVGPWGPPSMFLLGGGSFGLQIGAQAVDLVLVIMDMEGLESMLDSRFTLGGDASVAAGPVGRTAAAETDAWMKAKILAYSRARGLFGGLGVKGGVIRPDKDANRDLYDKPVRARELLLEKPQVTLTQEAQTFVGQLAQMSPQKNP